MNILSFKDEQKLSLVERKKYYQSLIEYLSNINYQHLSNGSLTICPKIYPLVRKALKSFCGYKIYVDGENVDGLVGIYANSHQDKYDHINFVVSNPNHTILMNSVVLNDLYKLILNINGVLYVDKQNKEDKSIVKLEAMKLLLNNVPLTIFPESAWNLSPNKLLLPMYIGMVDMARKTGKPIIPVVHEYVYKDMSDLKEHIDYVRVRFGYPIYVDINDDLNDKLEEVKEAMSTIRWQLIEEKGIHKRDSITSKEYIDLIEVSKKNLKNAGIDIKIEEKGIYDSSNIFYQDHYLNAIDYDIEKQQLLLK